jgi:Flp pilus assembly protein TadB
VSRAERSSADLARDIVLEAQALVRLEVDLAKQELRELLIRNAIAIGMLVVGSALALLALLVAVPVFLVLLWDRHVLGAAIWIGAYVIVGVGLVLAGRWTLRLEAPRRTLASLEETKEWALRQIRSSGR